jgi:hypothetical protein
LKTDSLFYLVEKAMKVRDFAVRPVELKIIRSLIETLHYSHSVNGLRISHCFGLYDGERLLGGMIYGKPGMCGAWKRYAEAEDDLVELRRLAIVDETPPTTESYFIGKTLRWLTQNTALRVVVSYADETHGHKGIIYRASNFQHKGMTPKGKMISWEGKLYHDKSIRTFFTNKAGETKLKPFAQRIRDALERGEATWVVTKPKHIYLYPLRDRHALKTDRVSLTGE